MEIDMSDVVGRACPSCRKPRPESDFRSAGRRAQCTACRNRTNELALQMRDGWPRARILHLWRRYRMRPEEYDALREKQDYRCAICGLHECDIPVLRSGRPRLGGDPAAKPFPLVVDHCHASGKVRGLLCQDCNISIGCAKDSPKILRAAIAYLEAGATPPGLVPQN